MIEREIIIKNHDAMPEDAKQQESPEKMPHRGKGRKKTYLSLFMVCIFVVGLCLGALTSAFVIPRLGGAVLVQKDYLDQLTVLGAKYSKMEYLNRLIQEYYYEEVDEDKLLEGAYRGLFDSLDEYSAYMSEEEYNNLINVTNSSFVGIGILMTKGENNEIVISGIYEDSPAMKAGLKEGDIIIRVDDKEFDWDKSAECSETLRKEAGGKSKVTFRRNGKEYTKTITCATVETGTVFSDNLNYEGHKIGYIRIFTFGHKTADEFDSALREMELHGTEAVIIDLRANGGGEVDAATAIADRLLPEGPIMVTKSRKEGETKVNSKEGCTNLPYVLLVNSSSASASEILAAAIKGNKAAPIVGETTYGKGVLQTVGKIAQNSDDAFKLTYAEYFGPGNLKINGKGIKPDYEVKLTADSGKDTQLEKALELAAQKCN